MNDQQNIEEIVNKILNHPIFRTSATYRKILTYLVDCSNKGKSINETDIAIEVLGKDQTFNPAVDTLVRVHIYKLRNKLDDYYKNEGKNDKLRLIIPKGHYYVTYEPAGKNNKIEGKKYSFILKPIVLVLILFLLLSNVYLWYSNKTLTDNLDTKILDDKTNFLWSDFITGNQPTAISFGFIFTFQEYLKDINSFRLVRDEEIESIDELDNFIKHHSLNKNNYSLPNWDIMPKSSLLNILAIQPIFIRNHKMLSYKAANEVEWAHFNTHNFIFIGHFHNLYIFKELFPSLYFTHTSKIYQTDSTSKGYIRQIRFQKGDIDTIYTYVEPLIEQNNYVKDYIILSKVPGPNNNVILFIISFHQIGRMETIKNIVDYSLLKQLELHLREVNNFSLKYFEALLEVQGYEETALKTKILHFYEIPSDFQLK
jgi:hypothetical protein